MSNIHDVVIYFLQSCRCYVYLKKFCKDFQSHSPKAKVTNTLHTAQHAWGLAQLCHPVTQKPSVFAGGKSVRDYELVATLATATGQE